MSKFATRFGRLAVGAFITAALVGLGGGVALADEDETPDGTVQEIGGAVADIEEKTGVADISEKVSDATGLTEIEEDLGVTKAEEGLGLG